MSWVIKLEAKGRLVVVWGSVLTTHTGLCDTGKKAGVLSGSALSPFSHS